MFTGIIEETGLITSIRKGPRSMVLTIEGNAIFEDLKLGDSVATNGVCLTVAGIRRKCFIADVMGESLTRSTLGGLVPGVRVNLERAMPANGRFGGHIVSGHVDGIGRILNIRKDDIAIWYTIHAGPGILEGIVEKGSIAVDGISLTVAEVHRNFFRVSVIPHTILDTTLSGRRTGDPVNLENDYLGKHARKEANACRGITRDFLSRYGY